MAVTDADIATLLSQHNALLKQLVTVGLGLTEQVQTIACTLQSATLQQAETPPARPVHHAAAPQRRVNA